MVFFFQHSIGPSLKKSIHLALHSPNSSLYGQTSIYYWLIMLQIALIIENNFTRNVVFSHYIKCPLKFSLHWFYNDFCHGIGKLCKFVAV